jgi:hypothetical protein
MSLQDCVVLQCVSGEWEGEVSVHYIRWWL